MMPKFSIIMPVYNVADYLDEALESVLLQTNKDYELIIINDGSTDESFNIIKSWLPKFKNKVIFINQSNRGLSEARNAGIKEATGKYIYFFDSDDYMHPQMLEILSKTISQYSFDLINFKVKTFKHGDYKDVAPVQYDLNHIKCYTAQEYVQKEYRPGVWSYLFKKELLDELAKKEGNYFLPKLLHEDMLFTPLYISQCKVILKLNYELYYYRVRPDSITTSQNNIDDKMKSLLYISEQCYKLSSNYTDWRHVFFKRRIMDSLWLYEKFDVSLAYLCKLYNKYEVFMTPISRFIKLSKVIIRRIMHKK